MIAGETGSTSLRVAGAVLALLVTAGALWAHAVVEPATSTTRAYETYTLRVPNEGDAPTTRVRLVFPPEVFIVSFAEIPGWELEVERDETGRAVAATWSGRLAPHRFVELSFVGVNPAEPTTLVWPVDQTYAGPEGVEVVSWSGPADSEHPASRTEIRGSDAAEGPAGAASGEETGRDVLAPVALLLSMIALVAAIRARKTPAE